MAMGRQYSRFDRDGAGMDSSHCFNSAALRAPAFSIRRISSRVVSSNARRRPSNCFTFSGDPALEPSAYTAAVNFT